jgi:hypothetical protein
MYSEKLFKTEDFDYLPFQIIKDAISYFNDVKELKIEIAFFDNPAPVVGNIHTMRHVGLSIRDYKTARVLHNSEISSYENFDDNFTPTTWMSTNFGKDCFDAYVRCVKSVMELISRIGIVYMFDNAREPTDPDIDSFKPNKDVGKTEMPFNVPRFSEMDGFKKHK